MFDRGIIEVLYDMIIIKIRQFCQKLYLFKLEEIRIVLPTLKFILVKTQYFIQILKVHTMVSNYHH